MRDSNFVKSIYASKNNVKEKVILEQPLFRNRKRELGFHLPEIPFKILAAPNVTNSIY